MIINNEHIKLSFNYRNNKIDLINSKRKKVKMILYVINVVN